MLYLMDSFDVIGDLLHTILLVHLLQAKEVLSTKPYFVIALVPVCQS
jgi:hypothetical protein